MKTKLFFGVLCLTSAFAFAQSTNCTIQTIGNMQYVRCTQPTPLYPVQPLVVPTRPQPLPAPVPIVPVPPKPVTCTVMTIGNIQYVTCK
jgi:hypothetical protein